MTEDQVRSLVRKRIAPHARRKGSTGLTAWCKAKGITKSHASEFMRGQRSPTSDLLNALNLEYGIVRKRKPKGQSV